MVAGISSIREALRKLGRGDDAPRDAAADPAAESAAADPAEETAAADPAEETAAADPAEESAEESAAADPAAESAEETAAADPAEESAEESAADMDKPLPDDETAKTAGAWAKGFKESWGGAYKASVTAGESKTEAPSAGGVSAPDSGPVSGPNEIPVEDLSIGIFNALSDGVGLVVKTVSTAGTLAATEARLRVKAIRSETASEYWVLREFITKLVCGAKNDRPKE